MLAFCEVLSTHATNIHVMIGITSMLSVMEKRNHLVLLKIEN